MRESPTPISPRKWRDDCDLTLSAVASMLGLGGKNPARTYQRYEIGDQKPPLWVMEKVQKLSRGRVTLKSWASLQENKADSVPA